MIETIKILWLVIKARHFNKHTYICIAMLDRFEYYQNARHISIEALAPVLNEATHEAVNMGYMTLKPTPEEQALLDARKAEYEEKARKGEL